MSLSLLLDEHISAAVAAQVQSRRPEIPIQSIYHWRSGSLAGADDEPLLAAAAEDGRTLVTYDQRTIAPLLSDLTLVGRGHSGVVFVDDKTIVIRTSAYGVIGRIGAAAELAFEVDRLDDAMREGWSVLLVGQMERVEDQDEATALVGAHDLEPWAGGVRNLVLRIRPRRVTGRRIEVS